MARYLNIGCGQRYSTDLRWENVDFHSDSERVTAHDLRTGLPGPDGAYDAVYASHVLEHFTRGDARQLVGECLRALRPGGVIRVVVPDLEGICRLYLEALDRSRAGDPDWKARYDWMMLELYDQVVRTVTGGEMGRHLARPDLPEKEFILSRIGNVGRSMIEPSARTASRLGEGTGRRRQKGFAERLGRLSGSARRGLAGWILGQRDRKALAVGLFRTGGEVHQWMYDGYSLAVLLGETGFEGIARRRASESAIAEWDSFHLDIGPDGIEHAPNSLYMEAFRPLR